MSIFFSEYARRGAELVRRIEALIPAHPEILALASPRDLHEVPGFACHDLEPTMPQVKAALLIATERHRRARAAASAGATPGRASHPRGR